MEKSYKVFIGGLPVRIDKEAICEFFSQFGTVLNCKLKKNQQTGRSLGFAYLTVKEKECYERLLEETVEFQGRIIEIKPVWKKNELGNQLENEKKKKIFVSNLPHNMTNSELISYFSRFGPLTNAYIIKDPDTRRNKNYGYVIFRQQVDFDNFFAQTGRHIVRGNHQIKVEKCMSQVEIKIKKSTTPCVHGKETKPFSAIPGVLDSRDSGYSLFDKGINSQSSTAVREQSSPFENAKKAPSSAVANGSKVVQARREKSSISAFPQDQEKRSTNYQRAESHYILKKVDENGRNDFIIKTMDRFLEEIARNDYCIQDSLTSQQGGSPEAKTVLRITQVLVQKAILNEEEENYRFRVKV